MGRIVVTGGAGFIGSHLCDALLARGNEVVAVDNLSTGREQNIAPLEASDGFTFVRADVVDSLPIDGPVDGVLHFASAASPPEYLAMPLETLDVGSIGTRRALDLARQHGARFLRRVDERGLRRSRSCIRSPRAITATSRRRACAPVYDEAKRFAETLTMTYHREYGLSTAIVRIFNTYGPRLAPADGRVVSNFLVQAIDGKPLTIYGDGTQTRSFCYVDDEVAGILALFDSDVVEPVNIGNPVELSMVELAKLVRRSHRIELGARLRGTARRRSRPDAGPTSRVPASLLGWEPKIALRDGLARTHDWYIEERARGLA